MNYQLDEKRYTSNRYVNCYCNKHANVLVGMKMFGYFNILLGLPSVVLLSMLFTFANIPILAKIGILTAIIGTTVLLPFLSYRDGKKMMLKANHTPECAHKIGRLIAIHGGGYSSFVIMRNKDDGKRTRW